MKLPRPPALPLLICVPLAPLAPEEFLTTAAAPLAPVALTPPVSRLH